MANSPVKSLKSLIVDTKSVEMEYPGMPGFKVKLSYISREANINIRKKATNKTWTRGKVVEELDEKLFIKLYVEAILKGWSGLTLEYLSKLVPMELGDADLSTEVEYSTENALDLVTSSAEFDGFITETSSSLANFPSNNKPSSVSN